MPLNQPQQLGKIPKGLKLSGAAPGWAALVMTDQVWFPRREETHRLVFGTRQILRKYLLMVNEEITAQFFKVEKRDGSGTREKLRENFWMFPEPNLCNLCYWKMSLLS